MLPCPPEAPCGRAGASGIYIRVEMLRNIACICPPACARSGQSSSPLTPAFPTLTRSPSISNEDSSARSVFPRIPRSISAWPRRRGPGRKSALTLRWLSVRLTADAADWTVHNPRGRGARIPCSDSLSSCYGELEARLWTDASSLRAGPSVADTSARPALSKPLIVSNDGLLKATLRVDPHQRGLAHARIVLQRSERTRPTTHAVTQHTRAAPCDHRRSLLLAAATVPLATALANAAAPLPARAAALRDPTPAEKAAFEGAMDALFAENGTPNPARYVRPALPPLIPLAS